MWKETPRKTCKYLFRFVGLIISKVLFLLGSLRSRLLHTCVRASLTLEVRSIFGAEVIREGSCCRTSRRLASRPSSMASMCSASLPEP